MMRHIHLNHSRASTAEGSKEKLGCTGSQSSFSGFGGVVDIQDFRAEDRARTCQSHGEVVSRPPTGKGQNDPAPCLRALRRGHRTDPWGSAGHVGRGEQAGQEHGDQTGQEHGDQKVKKGRKAQDHQRVEREKVPKQVKGTKVLRQVIIKGQKRLSQKGMVMYMNEVALQWQLLGGHSGMMLKVKNWIKIRLSSAQTKNLRKTGSSSCRRMDRLGMLWRRRHLRQWGFIDENLKVIINLGKETWSCVKSDRGSCQRSRSSRT